MKIKLLLFATVLTLSLSSCWKVDDVLPEDPVTNPSDTDEESFDFEVPDDFDWENFRVVTSKVTIYNRYDYPVEYGVEIYDGEDMVDAGITKNGVYTSRFSASRASSYLSVVQKDPSGARARVDVSLKGANLWCDFNAMFANVSDVRGVVTRSSESYSAPAAPTIPANAVEVVEGMEFVENGVYCISAGSVINNVALDQVSGVEIYIAGEYNIANSSWFDGEKENFSIYVLEGGKFTSNGELYSAKYKNLKIVNYGEFITIGNNAKIHINGSVLNAGRFSVGEGDAEFLLLDDSTFENYGDFSAGRLGLSKGTELKNYGDIEISESVWTQSTAFKLFENRGDFVVKGQIQLTGGEKVDNYGRIESESRLNIHDIGEVVLNPNSLIKAPDMDFQRTEFVSKGDAIIKIGTSLSVDYATSFVGDDAKPSVIYAPDGKSHIWFANPSNVTDKWIIDPDPNIWGAKWPEDVVLGNMGYVIAATTDPSNDGGYNSDKIEEIPDSLKDIAFASAPKIVIFEDNYPYIGDCDFNDIVLQWNLRGTKDASDKVKELYLDVVVKSCGAGRKVGAAVRIHSLSSKVSSATFVSTEAGKHSFDSYFAPINGVEADLNGVVVPLFESIHSLFGLELGKFINVTNNASNRCDYYKFSVKLEFGKDITNEDIKLENFDFFIVTGVNEKGRTEIHTFGNDVSLSANNEVTFKNPAAVWGIELPKEFLYPIEQKSIVLAYPMFQSWIESAGTSNVDWYESPEDGLVVENITEVD